MSPIYRIVGIIVILLIVLGIYQLFRSRPNLITGVLSSPSPTPFPSGVEYTATPSASPTESPYLTPTPTGIAMRQYPVTGLSLGEQVINITSEGFTPQSVTVKSGQFVTWVNRDNQAHQIAPLDGSPSNELKVISKIDPGEVVRIALSKPGTYNYYDTLHPQLQGQIVVQ